MGPPKEEPDQGESSHSETTSRIEKGALSESSKRSQTADLSESNKKNRDGASSEDEHKESSGIGSTSSAPQEHTGNSEETQQDPTPILYKLYKSRRFKGYLTICLASIINYNAASLSDVPIGQTAVSASKTQQRYAKAVSLWSAIITGILVVVHLDRYSPLQGIWRKAFQPTSKWETPILVFLVLWWLVAAIVQTSVKGIAGDGKEQYNLYYSTWVCCWTSLWCAEKKVVDYGYPTFGSFVTSWPYRSPGWIAIFLSCFFTLWWYIDLFANTKRNIDQIPEPLRPFYEPIPRSQYQWLLCVAAITLLPSCFFTIVEIFRESDSTLKGSVETILEGFCLLCLVVGWIPSVIAATTPGGFASQVGNAYFGTWATTVLVLETGLWFIHDWRERVHRAILEKEAEYRQHQQDVLEATLKLQEKRQLEQDEAEVEVDDSGRDLMDTSLTNIYRPQIRPANRRAPKGTSILVGSTTGDEVSVTWSQQDEERAEYDGLDAREEQLKKENKRAYFDNLDDLME